MKEGERMEHTFEKRKKVIYDLICDDLYCTDEAEGGCDASARFERTDETELRKYWKPWRLDGKIYVFKEREICQRTASVFKRNISGESSRIRICAQRG